jgi:iron complex outermembrane recepter protein
LGATGRGVVSLNGGGQSTDGGIDVANLNWRYDDGQWVIKAGLNASHSTRGRPDDGHFASLASTLIPAVRVGLTKGGDNGSNNITVVEGNQQPVDIYNLANYRLTGATESHLDNSTTFKSANLDLRRRIASWRVPASVQAGGAIRAIALDTRLQSISWTYNGPDGNSATSDSPAPYQMQVYKNQDSSYGFRNVPWLSVNRAWRAFQDNPILFSQTPAQLVAQESYRRSNSESVVETVSAGYVQFETRLLQNRLNLLTGARFERTTDDGEGALSDPNAVYVRDPDGTFARNAAGGRIRRADAGAAGSMAELQLILRERAYKAKRTYHGYYPSLHLTYEAREGLLLRLAYARTYGRPNFIDIIPNATINERDLDEEQLADPTIVRGNITVRNTSLRPWTADNYDLSLEYYTQTGGLLSGGLFAKNISEFFGTEVRLATAADLAQIGLDSRYVGWNLSTKFNAGDAKISGGELNLRQSLRALGGWGSYFTVFANATRLKLEGDRTADFSSFIPKSANWGVSFSRQKLTLSAKWNYRGLNRLTASPAYGPDAFQYYASRTTLALNTSYQMTPRLSLAASVNNVFNVPEVLRRYGLETPAYARQIRTSEFGVAMAIGLKGSF